MEQQLSKEEVEKLWKWIDRPLPPEFFTEKIPEGQHQQRADEIPAPYKRLAWAIYELALEHHKMGRDSKFPGACREFRILLFAFVKESKDQYPLPYFWFTDGVMILPEWIVRLTNGLVKWTCDDSVHECGALSGLLQCRFCEVPKENRRD